MVLGRFRQRLGAAARERDVPVLRGSCAPWCPLEPRARRDLMDAGEHRSVAPDVLEGEVLTHTQPRGRPLDQAAGMERPYLGRERQRAVGQLGDVLEQKEKNLLAFPQGFTLPPHTLSKGPLQIQLYVSFLALL